MERSRRPGRETDQERVRPGHAVPGERPAGGDRRRGWPRRFAVVVGALLLAAVVLLAARGNGSSTRVLGTQKFALPPRTSGCSGVTALAGGAVRVPITVSSVGSEVEALVNVCVDGQGPFPFVIDTGASSSAIDLGVAQRLHLPKIGSPVRYAGIGCTGVTRLEGLTRWSMAGLPLAAQPIAAQTIPGWGGEGEPVGLLGADVLSRFGALRLDFAAQTMTLPGIQGPTPSGPSVVTGPLARPIPSELTGGPPGSISGLRVTERPGYALATTLVHFRGTGEGAVFDVDTGAFAFGCRVFSDPSTGSHPDRHSRRDADCVLDGHGAPRPKRPMVPEQRSAPSGDAEVDRPRSARIERNRRPSGIGRPQSLRLRHHRLQRGDTRARSQAPLVGSAGSTP